MSTLPKNQETIWKLLEWFYDWYTLWVLFTLHICIYIYIMAYRLFHILNIALLIGSCTLESRDRKKFGAGVSHFLQLFLSLWFCSHLCGLYPSAVESPAGGRLVEAIPRGHPHARQPKNEYPAVVLCWGQENFILLSPQETLASCIFFQTRSHTCSKSGLWLGNVIHRMA